MSRYRTLQQFLNDPKTRNEHIQDKLEDVQIQCYVRKGQRYRKGLHHRFLEIGTVLTWPMNKGGWTSYIAYLFSILPSTYCGVYVETVHNEILDAWLNKNDWTRDPQDSISYWKLTNCKCEQNNGEK